VENELEKIEKILERLEGKSSTGYESSQRAQAVQKQRDNKVHNYDHMVTCLHMILLIKVYMYMYGQTWLLQTFKDQGRVSLL